MNEFEGLSPEVLAALKNQPVEKPVASPQAHEDYGLYVRDRQARRDEYEYRVAQHLDAWTAARNGAYVPESVESAIRTLVEEEFLEAVNQWAHDHPEEPRDP